MDKRGFTLLELLMVLGVLTIVIFFTISISISTKRNEKILLDQHIHMIANDIIYAKEYAIANNLSLVFFVDSANKRYFVYRGNFVLLEQSLPEDYQINAVFANIHSSFTISNLGYVDRFGSITITNRYGERRKLTITIKVGRVKVIVDD
ncbi:prepilin-type N-terminal cleavage/methylation domain-containing protein [Anaerobranca californiensis DSM 14826]|jgi:prepilin-type N-terminal cleavage/methylation domain-containing protein|uniref:Prepilin-type N-terminal cleavage/methylation domain-containing protein n=1 Tax=Anaerobranca californiensis DSM 14826 TaxID=1120989 RepID=A0A1M6LCC8_9FIRM|nr:prepilin-type N-terminal cleavage/methylation domain-containing protein [Anaerobranca californiensis]SHJ68823.1 prepilin-type N-terminal cleavage/methylation domain-containing protein [Anaerobranca californiensis DSM 14826]